MTALLLCHFTLVGCKTPDSAESDLASARDQLSKIFPRNCHVTARDEDGRVATDLLPLRILSFKDKKLNYQWIADAQSTPATHTCALDERVSASEPHNRALFHFLDCPLEG
jgi:hypothetical protein